MVQKKQQQELPEGMTLEEREEIEKMGLEDPSFPLMIFLVALGKDLIVDLASLGLLGWLGSALLGLVLWFWILGKVSFIQKRLLKYFIRRYLLAFVIGMIPLLNFLPEATLLVFLVHYREKKLIKVVLAFVEDMKKLPIARVPKST